MACWRFSDDGVDFNCLFPPVLQSFQDDMLNYFCGLFLLSWSYSVGANGCGFVGLVAWHGGYLNASNTCFLSFQVPPIEACFEIILERPDECC